MGKNSQNALEEMVRVYGLRAVLRTLAKICYAKAEEHGTAAQECAASGEETRSTRAREDSELWRTAGVGVITAAMGIDKQAARVFYTPLTRVAVREYS